MLPECEPPLLLPHRARVVDDAAHGAVGAPDVLVVVFGWPGAETVFREERLDLKEFATLNLQHHQV